MKRPSTTSSSSPSSPSSSTSSSSSSSCALSDVTTHQPEIPKTKRLRKTQNRDKCKNKNGIPNSNPSSARRSSKYRGVTRHRWTGRFEAHLWDKTSWNNIQNKKGRQGAYDCEEAAARTYDLAALKYWGPDTTLNFPIENYGKEIDEMQKGTKEEYLASLRRRSSGFSRGVSKYRGVARHHHNGRWEARIGRVFGNKYLYLGTYNTQEEAAAAYDMAAIEYRGANAVTNFDISHYIDRLKNKGILPNNSSTELSEPEPELEQQQQQPPPPPPKPERQEETTTASPELHHEYTQQQQHLVVPPISCMDSCCTTVVIDPTDTEAYEQELAWSFCLDTGSVPDIPMGNSGELLPDWFDNIEAGFEENIDYMFEAAGFGDVVGVSENMEGNIGNSNNKFHFTSKLKTLDPLSLTNGDHTISIKTNLNSLDTHLGIFS
ncbi:hypothetical protein LWI28_026591 [Acer negundo]|uniref:AP2/ERF domain-containing protein n=1 Tax=Acer negundo TaxID=4023 RepID=A0AAD5IBV4_ACENE|nr:hypothetical protein LWI28_026591 [Acer negundo]